MHTHIGHLVRSILEGHGTGMALTLAAMGAQTTGQTVGAFELESLAQQCRWLLQDLEGGQTGEVAVQFPDQSQVAVRVQTAPGNQHYLVHFDLDGSRCSSSLRQRWLQTYTTEITFQRHPEGQRSLN